MARRLTAAQAKQAKQKKLVIGLAVVFLIVAAVQGPRFMKQLHPKKAGEAAPTPGSVPASSGATGTGAPTAAAPGQLHSFSRLKLKDPFKALVTVPVPKDSSSGAPAAAAAAKDKSAPAPSDAAKAEAPPTPPKPKPSGEPAAEGTVSFSAAKPPPNAAIVTTNGRRQLVYVGDGFPTADPLFKLVALSDKAVRVGVLGGAFTSGAPTIKLATGKPVTLANEADGEHYVIKLVRLTTAAPKEAAPPEAATTTAPAPTTTPATTTATTTTTTPTTTTATS